MDTPQPLYIFDLDGTLADMEHRLGFIQGKVKDWDSFFLSCSEDEPIQPTVATLKALRRSGAEIWIWTGRSAIARPQTLGWLRKNGLTSALMREGSPFLTENALRMRPADLRTKDHVLKESWLKSLSVADRSRLVATFEDRQQVVDMWRQNGVTCYQVDYGNF